LKTEPKKISLEYNFNSHQKIHLSIFSGICVVILIGGLQQTINLHNFGLLTFFFLILTGLIVSTFSKKGFVVVKNRLYKGIFFRDILLFKREINLANKPVFSILKFRKKQKYAFFTAANPDLAYEFNAFDIYLLNEKHTIKTLLISLQSEHNSQKASKFISDFTDLDYEIYSPDFG
jgi:hypothetical protein